MCKKERFDEFNLYVFKFVHSTFYDYMKANKDNALTFVFILLKHQLKAKGFKSNLNAPLAAIPCAGERGYLLHLP